MSIGDVHNSPCPPPPTSPPPPTPPLQIPTIGFIYFAGWLGFAGTKYIQIVKEGAKPIEKEIIIGESALLGHSSGSRPWCRVLHTKERSQGRGWHVSTCCCTKRVGMYQSSPACCQVVT